MKLSTAKGFGGIDQRAVFANTPEIASEMMNFRVTDSGSIVKRQGKEWLWNAPGKIEYIWSGSLGGEEMLIVAADSQLYRILTEHTPAVEMLLGNIGTGKCFIFEFNGVLYIKTATSYHKYDGKTLIEVEGYIPLVALSCSPSGDGEVFEQINLICEKRRQLFSSTGSTLAFKLAESDISGVVSVTIDGEDEPKYEVYKDEGRVIFYTPPPEGLNNVEIVYTKSDDSRSRIFGCTKMTVFGGNSDGRLFLWGNDDYPNHRFHSDLADGIPSAEYFPVNAFTIIGNSKINCIVQQYDKQLIFTDSEAYYSYCELRNDTLGNTYSSFPVFSLNNGKGCIFETEGCIIDNRPVTLCADGLNMWESTTVVNEKNAVCFSAPIQSSMREIINGDKSNIKMFDFQANRELFFVCGGIAYIYNYGNGSWYTYNDFAIDCCATCGKSLYFSYKDVLYVFGNDRDAVLEMPAYWESAFINGGHNHGNCDVVKLEADVHLSGLENIRFEFKRSGTDYLCMRELNFPEDTEKFMRISMRPYLKRAMPFKITFTDNGPGKCTLHGFTITTRNKERSYRNGIL